MERKLSVATLSPLTEEKKARIRAAAGDLEVIFTDKASTELAGCEVVFGRPNPEALYGAKNLKWLHTQIAGVGIYLGPESGLAEDVIVTNSAGVFGVSISEHLLVVTLMLLRRMGEYGRQQAETTWKSLVPIQSLYGSTVAVVGLGDIGSSFAMRCMHMGAKVVRGVVRTPRAQTPPCVHELYTTDNMDTAINNADIVALCMPGTPETRHLFDKKRLLGMKRGAFIINVGRGNAIDHDALIECLASGHLGGAGLDVTEPEPLPASSPLWAMPNVIITPHSSHGISLDVTLDAIVDKFVEYLGDYVAGRPFRRTVDRKLGY